MRVRRGRRGEEEGKEGGRYELTGLYGSFCTYRRDQRRGITHDEGCLFSSHQKKTDTDGEEGGSRRKNVFQRNPASPENRHLTNVHFEYLYMRIIYCFQMLPALWLLI